MSCRICGGPERALEDGLYDDRYGYPGLFSLVECATCGHKRLDAAFSPDQLMELYTSYYPRSMYQVGKHKPHTEKSELCKWINGDYSQAYRWVPRNVRVLDIGCGFGETLGYHQSRGCEAFGVEADANARAIAEKYGYKIHIGLFSPDLYEPGYFDYVTMDQVIEHLAEPLGTLRGVARILKIGGRVVLSTPNADGWGRTFFGRHWVHWHAPYHLQHFSERSMRLAAEKAGFSVETVQTITLPLWLHFQHNHLLAFPEMGHPSPYWVPFEKKTRKWKAVALTTFLLFHCTGFNHLVTRMGDLLGASDNYLFIFKKI